MNVTLFNLSANFSATPIVNVARIRDVDFIRQNCAHYPTSIFIVFASYWGLILLLQILYRFDKVTMEQYALYAERIFISYLILGSVALVYLGFLSF
jgi:hypothetical protein